jgi:hypothetical protein
MLALRTVLGEIYNSWSLITFCGFGMEGGGRGASDYGLHAGCKASEDVAGKQSEKLSDSSQRKEEIWRK